MTQIDPFSAGNDLAPSKGTAGGSLSAPASQDWMKAPATDLQQALIDANQLTSLSAMIAYIATQSGQSEFRIERILADRFNIPNAKYLPASQFDSAIHYLVDVLAA